MKNKSFGTTVKELTSYFMGESTEKRRRSHVGKKGGKAKRRRNKQG